MNPSHKRERKVGQRMNTFDSTQTGRWIVIHLFKGEDILKGITEQCRRLGIRNAIVTSGIGSLRQASYHRIETLEDNATNTYLTYEKPTELCSVQGLVIDGEPHLHATFCDPGKAYGGHMEPGCLVQYLAEISLIELKGVDLVRRPDAFGISYIDKR